MVVERLVSVPAAAGTAIHFGNRPNRSLSGKPESVKMKKLAYCSGKTFPSLDRDCSTTHDGQHRDWRKCFEIILRHSGC